MHTRHALGLVLLSCAGLSCAIWQPDPGLIGPTAPAVTGAPALDRIEARFAERATGLSSAEIREVARAIDEQARLYDIDPELVLAVIHTESGFNNFARSHVGALGLMQIMPPTGQMLAAELGIPWVGPGTLFDPVTNVEMGTHYLHVLHTRYGGWGEALAAYNWGPHAIDRRLRRGHRLPERYATKVLAQLQSPAIP